MSVQFHVFFFYFFYIKSIFLYCFEDAKIFFQIRNPIYSSPSVGMTTETKDTDNSETNIYFHIYCLYVNYCFSSPNMYKRQYDTTFQHHPHHFLLLLS